MIFLGPLPKGGHGRKDYNTRTQVTFAVFAFILGFTKGFCFLCLFHFWYFIWAQISCITCNEHSRTVGWKCVANRSLRLFYVWKMSFLFFLKMQLFCQLFQVKTITLFLHCSNAEELGDLFWRGAAGEAAYSPKNLHQQLKFWSNQSGNYALA